MKLRARNLTSEILATVLKAPATLTGVCAAIQTTPRHAHQRLRGLGRRGLLKATTIQKAARRPGERRADNARVVWHAPDAVLPDYKHLEPQHTEQPKRPRRQRRNVDPFTKDGRSPIEILAMLSGRTNYTVPVEGKSTKGPGITALDVAHAISASPEKLGAAMALAIACQRDGEWQNVNKQTTINGLLKELGRQRAMPGIVAGPYKFRVRIVLDDVFQGLIRPQQRAPYRKAAAEACIAERTYKFMHRHITAYLQAKAAAAANDACKFLFSPFGINKRRHTLVLADGDGNVTVLDGQTQRELTDKLRDERTNNDRIDLLLEHMLEPGSRQRTLGVLTLHGVRHVVVYVDNSEETTS